MLCESACYGKRDSVLPTTNKSLGGDTSSMSMKLVLIRHGESVWNKENLFTGWTDVDLSDTGKKEAAEAAAAPEPAPAPEPEPTKEEILLAEIRDLLKEKK